MGGAVHEEQTNMNMYFLKSIPSEQIFTGKFKFCCGSRGGGCGRDKGREREGCQCKRVDHCLGKGFRERSPHQRLHQVQELNSRKRGGRVVIVTLHIESFIRITTTKLFFSFALQKFLQRESVKNWWKMEQYYSCFRNNSVSRCHTSDKGGQENKFQDVDRGNQCLCICHPLV